jgi:hypothetical protein
MPGPDPRDVNWKSFFVTQHERILRRIVVKVRNACTAREKESVGMRCVC